MTNPAHRPTVTRLARGQLAGILATVVVISIFTPISVMAATGSFVNIRDYRNTDASGQARVVNNHLATTACDAATTGVTATSCIRVVGGKLLVSDGSGAFTVDGTVQPGYPAAPYFGGCDGGIVAGNQDGACHFTLPAGKRLVVESLFVDVDLPATQTPGGASLLFKTGGQSHDLLVPLVYQSKYAADTRVLYNGNPTMRLYLDAGTDIYLEQSRSDTSGSTLFQLRVSGYLA